MAHHTKKTETLEQATSFIKDQHIDPLKDRMGVLEGFKTDFELNFDAKVLNSICKNVDVQTQVKKLVWQTVKDKIVWILVGAAITLTAAFAQGYVSEIGRSVFAMQNSIATQQGG